MLTALIAAMLSAFISGAMPPSVKTTEPNVINAQHALSECSAVGDDVLTIFEMRVGAILNNSAVPNREEIRAALKSSYFSPENYESDIIFSRLVSEVSLLQNEVAQMDEPDRRLYMLTQAARISAKCKDGTLSDL